MSDLTALDESLLNAAHATSPSLKPLFLALTYSGGALGFAVLIPFLVWKKTRLATAWLFGAIFGQAAIVGALKVVFARLRPCMALPWCVPFADPCPTSGSMPSGHTAGAFTFATYIAVRYPKWAVPALLWAALVGTSRCVLGMHYPTDVTMGALVGIAFGTGFGIAAKRYEAAMKLRAVLPAA